MGAAMEQSQYTFSTHAAKLVGLTIRQDPDDSTGKDAA